MKGSSASMTVTRTATGLLCLAAVSLLGACEPGAVARSKPELASESECFLSGNFQRCQFNHYLAGGYPIVHDRSP